MILTRKLITPALLVFAALLAGLFTYFFSTMHTTYHDSEEADLRSFSDAFFAEMENRKVLALALAVQAAANPAIQTALAEGDAQQLSEQMLPVDELIQLANVNYYGFFSNDGRLILSQDARRPVELSDIAAGSVLLETNSERTPTAGLELEAGRIGIRGVAPVFYQGEYVGAVMLSVGLNQSLLLDLREKYGGEWQILISQDSAGSSASPAIENPIPGFIVFATTQDNPLFNIASGYERALAGTSTITHPGVDGRDYAILSTPVYDYSDRIIGVLDIVYDHTHISQVQNSQLFLAGIVTITALLLGSLGLILLTRRTLRPIQQLTSVISDIAEGNIMRNINIAPGNDEVGVLINVFNRMTLQLRSSIAELEQHVADRTQDLENQTLRLRAAAEIARDTASARDLGELLERSAQLILDRFQFYHVGIFMLDKNREYAVLSAAPTAAGREMLTANYKLRIGDTGIVERVATTGEPRSVLDRTGEIMTGATPLLPESRSEVAVPLRVEGNIIGVLDLHSDQPQAFRNEDIAILQVLADQLATAIERTRLLEAVERNLEELERAYGEYTRAGWQRIAASGQIKHRGYRFDNIRIEPVRDLPVLGRTAVETGRTVSANGMESSDNIAIPIRFRGETIGVVSAKLREGFAKNTILTLQAAAERLGSALESARLYEEASLRADREQSISQVISAISSSTEYEEILRTTVMEIGAMLKDTEVAIRIIDGSGDRAAGESRQT